MTNFGDCFINSKTRQWRDAMREVAESGDMPFKEYIVPNIGVKRWEESEINFTAFFTYKLSESTQAHVMSSTYALCNPRQPWVLTIHHNWMQMDEMFERYDNLTDEKLMVYLATFIKDSPLPETTNQPLNQLEQP